MNVIENMTTQKMISDLNLSLVSDHCDISIIDYVKLLNKKIFNIDIDFIDDFIDLVDKEGFTISHDMLFKYKVLQKTDSANVLRSLNSYNLEELIDYNCLQTGVDDGRTHKNIFYLTQDAFKTICMRSPKTKKYAQYYIMLEKCIKYYSDYEKLKLQHKINEINKIKLLKLENSETLDNYVIIRDDRKKTFKYATIRGSHKNLRETLHDLNLTDENIIYRIVCPHAANFTKKIKEELNDNYRRQKVYAIRDKNGKITKKWFEEEDDEEPTFIDDEEYVVTCNRWFQIKGMSEKEFILKIKEINELRFE